MVEIDNGTCSLYATVSQEFCLGSRSVSINGLFAEKQGLKNNDEVHIFLKLLGIAILNILSRALV